ncbi:hypothetical protein [Brevundimonas bacteroides]|nr:hypothetical protein [Brevundimonas bacteroides]
MPMRDRTDNPFWPPVASKRRRWGKLVVFAATAVAGGVVLTALLNG